MYRLLANRVFIYPCTRIPQVRFVSSKSKTKPSVLRRISKGLFYSTLLSASGLTIYVHNQHPLLEEKIRRTTYFWSHMTPVYIHYRYQQLYFKVLPSDKEDEQWNYLHNKYCDYVYNLVLHQRGVYIKLGQIASTRPDIIPKPYLKKFAQLQDGVPPQSGEYAIEMIEKAFDQKIDNLFSEFNLKAVGAATIGQAHEAKLKSSGKEVIIKIQYPEVRRLFQLDFSTLKRFVRLAQPEHLPLFDEFERSFQIEFDFRREAKALDIIGKNIMPKYKNVVIPRPIRNLSSEYVLVMEKLDGIKLIDGLKIEQAKMAEAQGKTLEQFEDEMMKKYLSGELYKERNAPSKLLVQTYGTLLKTITNIANLFIVSYNYTFGWILHKKVKYFEHRVIINPREIIDLLNDVHAHEILLDGIFNADPHPGNVFLLKSGKIGLIDFGQVQELTLEQRLKLAKLIVLLAEGTRDEIVQHYSQMGAKTKFMNPYVLEKLARLGFDRDDPEVCEGMNAQLFFEKLSQIDQVIELPQGYLMAARVGILLRGLGTWLQIPHSTAQKWLPIAKQLLEQYRLSSGIDYITGKV